MSEHESSAPGEDLSRYAALMEVVRARKTNRAFAPYAMPRDHIERVLEAARHSPSGANSQPWHFIVVEDPALKERIGGFFVEEQLARAKMKMGFPTPNYNGMKTAPGFIVIAADFRYVRAFPVLGDGSELDALYRANAERILVQSVAAATMAAHLAAAALGYAVWWVTAIGQENMQKRIKPLLDVPDALSVVDVMCFGPPLKPSYTRWKRELNEIAHWGRFDRSRFPSDADLDVWVRTQRHQVMYKDQTNVD